MKTKINTQLIVKIYISNKRSLLQLFLNKKIIVIIDIEVLGTCLSSDQVKTRKKLHTSQPKLSELVFATGK